MDSRMNTYEEVRIVSHTGGAAGIPIVWCMVWYWARDVKAGGFIRHNAPEVAVIHMGVN
jgi:hypothetical protein